MPGTKQGSEDESNARSNEEDNPEISWKLRSLPPSHYIFKIESFSLLSDAKAECFRSADFEVGGYKWKLAVFFLEETSKTKDTYLYIYFCPNPINSLSIKRLTYISSFSFMILFATATGLFKMQMSK
ncbi:uncharacterized protein LOC126661146 [Mercurialis annua]|uniref:uncharacterized protein LOC126661146 n=1 Tax=Mercurialis annua TaxID=3986 RepID=UPI00215FEE8F|nr:uncharacterized protein LOC126661146 [Mercurialis annua]